MSTERKMYTATVARDGDWFMVAIPDIDGLTQARSRDEVEQVAREYIAVTTGADIESIAVTVTEAH